MRGSQNGSQERTAGTDNKWFWNSRSDKHRKRWGEIKIEWLIAVVCTINKICAGEIPQETQVKNRKNRTIINTNEALKHV